MGNTSDPKNNNPHMSLKGNTYDLEIHACSKMRQWKGQDRPKQYCGPGGKRKKKQLS